VTGRSCRVVKKNNEKRKLGNMKNVSFEDKTVLITGGTGSLGQELVRRFLEEYNFKKIIVFSRDEYKQFKMKESLKQRYSIDNLRFFIGDIRDQDRLYRAFEGVDYVVHAAALKHVNVCEYNPFEAVRTNINGAQNVIEAAIDKNVKKVIALSTDKAANPINLYGATKLCSDKIILAGNVYSGKHDTVFSVVRYGNVAGSRGSVIPYFKSIIEQGVNELPITDIRMTRFWITIQEAADFVINALETAIGGEIYVPKIPSFRIVDLAKAMNPKIDIKIVGIRPGEKLHEAMITPDDSRYTYEYESYYIIYPQLGSEDFKVKIHQKPLKKVDDYFMYSSDLNNLWFDVETIEQKLDELQLLPQTPKLINDSL
jgi:UDP-N-acetylglucosamine 4,6-dehydratase (inverting)